MDKLQAFLDLSLVAWPTLPPKAFQSTDQKQVDDFTFRLAESKISELNSISTTSALVAGIVAAIYSWPSFSSSPWPAKSLYGASFIFSLCSIRKALQQSYILRRLELHSADTRTEAGDKIRFQLATKTVGGEWKPSGHRQMIWNSSVLFLNMAILCLVAGYGWMVLGAAVEKSWDVREDDTKIAAVLSAVSVVAVTHYVTSGTMIYSRYITVPK